MSLFQCLSQGFHIPNHGVYVTPQSTQRARIVGAQRQFHRTRDRFVESCVEQLESPVRVASDVGDASGRIQLRLQRLLELLVAGAPSMV